MSASLAIGSWFYPGSPLRDDVAEIRFLIGDTDPDRPLINDEAIADALAMASDKYITAMLPTTLEPSTVVTGTSSIITTTLAYIGPLTTPMLSAVGSYAAGATVMTFDATEVQGALRVGETFGISGHRRRYVVRLPVVAASNALVNVTFWPGLVAAVTDDTAVMVRTFDIHEAAALCCEHLARRFATDVDVSVDGRSESFSQRSRQFAALAVQLRGQSSSGGTARLVRS